MHPNLPKGGRTLVYTTVDGHDLHLDYYLPDPVLSTAPTPVMVYYHGGGMTAGSRQDFQFPCWLFDHCQVKGYILVAADYRLCHPCTVFDQIEDAKSLFQFLVGPEMASSLPSGVSVKPTSIAVAGWSAGAYSARAACIYAQPRPAVLLSVFNSGGDWLLRYLTTPRPPTSIAQASDLSLVPRLLDDRQVVSDDTAEGNWFSSRFSLTIQWELDGTLLDIWLGYEGLGTRLNEVQDPDRVKAIPEHLKPAFLQLFVTEDHPPSVFIHGTADDVVLQEESIHHHEQLQSAGVDAKLLLVKSGTHGLLDFKNGAPPRPCEGAPEAYARALEFIDEAL